MKEFDSELKNIFNGLSPKEINKKSEGTLLECHNLEPVDNDYKLHEFVIDINTDSYSWGNA